MSIFKFSNKKQCKHKMTLRSHIGFVISEERCVFDAGHLGAHCDRNGRKWVTMDKQQQFLEEHFR